MLEARWRAAIRARERALRKAARRLTAPDPAEAALVRSRARALRGRWRAASVAELRQAARAARVALVGDYRSLPSFSPCAAQVLRAFAGEPIVLAVQRTHRWVKEAKRRGAHVVDIDSRGPLHERLARAANRIARASQRWPEARVLVVAGELLTAPIGLPAVLRDRGLAPDLIVHRDPEIGNRVLTSLWRRGPRFASIEVPPLYLDDAFVASRRREEVVDPVALRPSFAALLDRVATAMGERVPAPARRTPVLLATDERVPRALGHLRPADAALALEEIRRGESFFLRQPRCVVLSSLSVTDAAEEAAHLLRASLGGARDPRWRADLLYARALHEAIGFAGAALIGARRRAPDAAELRRMARGVGVAAQGAQLGLEVLRLWEAGLGAVVEWAAAEAPDAVLLVAAHLLGYRLGARLASDRRSLRALLRADLAGEGEARRWWRRIS